MSESAVQRRLAAIMAVDVVGYSRLMGQDEAGTLAVLKQIKNDVINPKITEHQGRVFKTMGDGLLVEFSSVVAAVACAVAIQKAMVVRNLGLPQDGATLFRIGVNLGDVIVEGDDVFGDGVNVAARLESISPPGGVVVSAAARDQVGNRLDLDFEDMGEQQLKNIDKPVRAYCISHGVGAREIGPKLGAERPMIAVLPFSNMSGDVEQEYFSDGISEDLITELSKFRSLIVISRNSAFAFKGQQATVTEISRKLRVRYVVEGSVRRSGNRLRITAQLIDAAGDSHLWAERFDRELADIFDVQDEVVRAIVSAIEPKLLSSEQNRALRKLPENLDAWENYQRGLWNMFQYRPEDRDSTLTFLQRAIELDPGFSSAHAGLGYALYIYIILGASPDRQKDIARAIEAATTAVRLDERDSFGWTALARGHILRAEHAAAIYESDIAISLNNNFALAHFGRGHALWHAGRPSEALESLDLALRLSPLDPVLWSFFASKAIALVMLGRFEEAIEVSQRSQRHAHAAIFSHLGEISALGHLERRDEAKAAIASALLKNSELTISYVRQTLPVSDETCRELFLGGLRKAGLSE